MLVLDLDDTLLRDDYSLSDRNCAALIRAQEAGVYVVLASGRPSPAMMQYAQQLQLGKYGSYIIAFNGGMILDIRTGKEVFSQCLTRDEIHNLYDFSTAHNVDIITYLDGCIVSETLSEYIDVEVNLTKMEHRHVQSFKSAVDKPAVKCILLQEPGYLRTVASKLKDSHKHLNASVSKPFFLEVTQKGIDKAASIAILAEKLGIERGEIIAVGNAENDLSMVQYAGLGIWVNNVAAELLHHGDAVVASNMEDGVADVVEKYIFS